MGVEVGELAVVEARFQGEDVAAVLRNSQPEMSDVGGSWWDQVDPGRRARGNGVALVDRVAVAIDQARGIEMGPPIDRTAATIFDDARPKYDASVFVGGLESSQTS